MAHGAAVIADGPNLQNMIAETASCEMDTIEFTISMEFHTMCLDPMDRKF